MHCDWCHPQGIGTGRRVENIGLLCLFQKKPEMSD